METLGSFPLFPDADFLKPTMPSPPSIMGSEFFSASMVSSELAHRFRSATGPSLPRFCEIPSPSLLPPAVGYLDLFFAQRPFPIVGFFLHEMDSAHGDALLFALFFLSVYMNLCRLSSSLVHPPLSPATLSSGLPLIFIPRNHDLITRALSNGTPVFIENTPGTVISSRSFLLLILESAT